MPRVTYLDADGAPTELDVPAGRSVMQGATGAGLDGIVAECGGELVCATCHVYVVSEAMAGTLPPMGPLEDELLDHVVAERRDSSRLSCQLLLGEEHDGLVVALPDAQV